MPRYEQAHVVRKPLPNARLPLLLVLMLTTAIVLVYLFYLRPPAQLLGGPIHPNEYEKALKGPKPKPVVIQPLTPAPATPAAVPAAPAASANGQ